MAAARRLLFVCTSHYVDDFPVFDHSAGEGSAQVSLNFLANLCGMPFAKSKKQLEEVIKGEMQENINNFTVSVMNTPGVVYTSIY